MNSLFTELNITISDNVLDVIKKSLPLYSFNKIELTELQLDYSLFGKELLNFSEHINKIQISSVPPKWHSSWGKNEKTIIRIPIEFYNDSAEFVIESPKIDKDTMFKNKFKTYKIPYVYKKLYAINGEKYHITINYSNDPQHYIDIIQTLSYSELLTYFANQ